MERDRYLMTSEFGGKKIPSKRRGEEGIVLLNVQAEKRFGYHRDDFGRLHAWTP